MIAISKVPFTPVAAGVSRRPHHAGVAVLLLGGRAGVDVIGAVEQDALEVAAGDHDLPEHSPMRKSAGLDAPPERVARDLELALSLDQRKQLAVFHVIALPFKSRG
jgi:hypothetical protein